MVRRGRVVVIPTDALYTLVADPFNLRAVSRVFAAKGRDFHRSLPLLISDSLMAEDLARQLSTRFYLLARRFWPGPLTIIVPAAPKVPLRVTGNTGRLALRQSRSAVANALVAQLNQPLISTSANISGQPTCRSGIDVFGTMDGRVDAGIVWWILFRRGLPHYRQIVTGAHLAAGESGSDRRRRNRRVPGGNLRVVLHLAFSIQISSGRK